MSTRVLYAAALSLLSSLSANAQGERNEFCPHLKQVDIVLTQKPWTHKYVAVNDEGKVFVSKEYTENFSNGPAPLMRFVDSYYDEVPKKLSCVYWAFTRSENSNPTLVNEGDY